MIGYRRYSTCNNVTLPSNLLSKVPVVTVKFPILVPVAAVVPIKNLSALSSHPIKTLVESPLSIIIPLSFEGVPVVPLESSIILSFITVLLVLTVVVVPVTVRFPVIVTLHYFLDIKTRERVPTLVISLKVEVVINSLLDILLLTSKIVLLVGVCPTRMTSFVLLLEVRFCGKFRVL